MAFVNRSSHTFVLVDAIKLLFNVSSCEPNNKLVELDASLNVDVVQCDHLFYILPGLILADKVVNRLLDFLHRQIAVCTESAAQ